MPCNPALLQQYGNVLTVASFATLPTGTDRYVGRVVCLADTGNLLYWDGTAWRGIRTKRFAPVTMSAVTTVGAVETVALATLTVPDQQCAGVVRGFATLYAAGSVAADAFQSYLKFAGTAVSCARVGVVGGAMSLAVTGEGTIAAGASLAVTVTMARIAGTGTGSSFADPTLCRLDAMFIPT